jgi:hypothetical protein
MGFGSYSVTASTERSLTSNYAAKSVREVFVNRQVISQMSPYGVSFRESRDSAEHPNSFPIVLGLDVTGSMGSIPHSLISTGLTKIMGKIMQAGQKDPQILFVAVGDHECDSSPLQVGQFESSDELLDKWLKNVYLESGGGGNDGESYHLAWYFAAKHTSTDSFEKRKKKGLLFTIGDEPVLHDLPKHKLAGIMGNGQFDSYSSMQLLDEARKTYDVYHIHVNFTNSGRQQRVQDGWKQLMGDNVLFASNQDEICNLISDTVIKHSVSCPVIQIAQETRENEIQPML